MDEPKKYETIQEIQARQAQEKAEDPKIRGFFASFFRSQGIDNAGVELPYNSLHPLVSQAILEISDVKQVSEEMIFGQILALASAGISATKAVFYRDDWCSDRANLFILIANPSGGGKSHAWRYVFKDVTLKEITARLEYDKKNKEYIDELAEYTTLSKSEKKDTQKPQPPSKIKFIVDDATMAGIAEAFKSNPRGMIWADDEFSGFFQGKDAHSKTGAAEAKKKFLKFYDGEPLNATRRSKDGASQDIFVQNAFLTLFGQVQTHLLKEVFTERDIVAGLTPRFLMLNAKRDKCPQAHDRKISKKTSDTLKILTEKLYNFELTVTNTGIYGPEYIQMTDEATAKFNNYYNMLMSNTFGDAVEESFAQKGAGQTLRIALILHCINNALAQIPVLGAPDIHDPLYGFPEPGAPAGSTKITEQEIESAINIMNYFYWNLYELWDLIPGGKGITGKDALILKIILFIKANKNFCGEWRSTGEMLNNKLIWSGVDSGTQGRNLGTFLTSIITGGFKS